MKIRATILACLALAAVLVVNCQSASATNISGTTFTGESYDLFSTAGKPAVINFWFPSCAPCRVELPDLQAAYEEYSDRVEFLGVFTPTVDSQAQAIALLDELGVTYPNLIDTTGQFMLDYSAIMYPTTLFVSADHSKVSRYVGGPIPYETLEASIEELLN